MDIPKLDIIIEKNEEDSEDGKVRNYLCIKRVNLLIHYNLFHKLINLI